MEINQATFLSISDFLIRPDDDTGARWEKSPGREVGYWW